MVISQVVPNWIQTFSTNCHDRDSNKKRPGVVVSIICKCFHLVQNLDQVLPIFFLQPFNTAHGDMTHIIF